MEEEEIVRGAQVIGRVLWAMGLLIATALMAGAYWAWRHWAG